MGNLPVLLIYGLDVTGESTNILYWCCLRRYDRNRRWKDIIQNKMNLHRVIFLYNLTLICLESLLDIGFFNG